MQAGGSVNAADWSGRTPLMLALEAGHLDCARTLLCAGASMSVSDKRGETAVVKCVLKNQEACLDLLLKVGAEINTPTLATGDTPLILAVRSGAEPMCRRIICFKGNVNVANPQQETALILAAEGGHLQIVHTLLLSGADTTYQDLEGHTALMRAAAAGRAHVCALLLDFGAEASVVSPIDGETPATVAARCGHLDVYQVLEAAGARVRAVDDDEVRRPPRAEKGSGLSRSSDPFTVSI